MNIDPIEMPYRTAEPDALVQNESTTQTNEFKQALDDYWVEADRTNVYGYFIKRACLSKNGDYSTCSLSISRNGKRLQDFESEYGSKNWLQYGFFDFLGNGKKQLIVHTYSGGAHCCYGYYIFDLGHKFRTVYSSGKYDSGNEIGDQLVPVDIDGDGVYEFYQDVMAFDYVGPGGHATATFPPAIFAYHAKKSTYELANKRFPDFVLKKLEENIESLENWRRDSVERGSQITQDEIDEIKTRETFLYWVYAGKRDDAWAYFEKNYRTDDGDKYRDEFRDQFRREFKEIFSKDPTYKSVYRR